jgi:TonB-linked SusC/RagA family outer membrane protein
MRKKLTLLCFVIISMQALVAQTIKGKIDDDDKIGLSGVLITNLTTASTVQSNQKGEFEIKATAGDMLTFSKKGFTTEEIKNTSNKFLNVILSSSIHNLEEVVVTALGIKRGKKALGYATQELKSEDVTQSASVNFINTLAGKVAGVKITGSGNGLSSSSKISIRGDRSLVLTNNNPLIVIDGTPFNDNLYGVGGGSTAQANLPADYGTGLADINQEDIETINVLKGAAASALYGSRAANGVILITTKSGKFSDKFSVNFSSSTMFSNPLKLWDIQNQYAAGTNGKYDPAADTNFGPKLDGSVSAVQNGSPGYYPNGTNATTRPLVFRYDLNDFFQTGLSRDNAIDISGGSDKISYRLGYNNTASTGIVPNTDLTKNNYTMKVNFKITPKWELNSSVAYIRTNSDNVLASGYGSQGIMYNLMWNHTNVDLNWLKDYWFTKDKEQVRMFSWGDNVYKIAFENINAFDRNRLTANFSTKYNFTENLSLMARLGSDYFNDFRFSRRPLTSSRYPNGQYREQTVDFRETNLDFLLSYNKTFGNLTSKFSFGSNNMQQITTENFIEGKGISIPGIYNLQNINVTPSMYRNNFEKTIIGAYAFANFGYKDYIFADITARNDWSSTLPIDNNSYFYPSASLSFVPSSIFALGKSINYLKLRGNYAVVGNDTDPYKLQAVYSNATLPGSLTNSRSIANASLSPERTNSYEVGAELIAFDKRVSLDVSYYRNDSKNQIIGIPVSETSGFSSRLINAGLIKNWGTEITLGLVPIRTQSFEWSLQTNFSKNDSKVVELSEGLTNYIVASGPNGGRIEARVGGRMGDIYGFGYLRNEQGQIIYKDGSPELDTQIKKIGNYNPDWMLGLSSTFKYKNLSLYALFDYRHGGIIYSMTNAIGMESGLLAVSLPGREGQIVGPGVTKDTSGNFVQNTVGVSPEVWYYGNAYQRGNIEANSFDATYLKFREINITYMLPKQWVSVVGAKNISFSLVGNNLALWTDVPNIDPESHSLEGGVLTPGFEVMQLPSSRNYGFRFNLNF